MNIRLISAIIRTLILTAATFVIMNGNFNVANTLKTGLVLLIILTIGLIWLNWFKFSKRI